MQRLRGTPQIDSSAQYLPLFSVSRHGSAGCRSGPLGGCPITLCNDHVWLVVDWPCRTPAGCKQIHGRPRKVAMGPRSRSGGQLLWHLADHRDTVHLARLRRRARAGRAHARLLAGRSGSPCRCQRSQPPPPNGQPDERRTWAMDVPEPRRVGTRLLTRRSAGASGPMRVNARVRPQRSSARLLPGRSLRFAKR